ncbi:hypothetical protein U1Q18_052347 [Sarracenia purpurea var. burkii]
MILNNLVPTNTAGWCSSSTDDTPDMLCVVFTTGVWESDGDYCIKISTPYQRNPDGYVQSARSPVHVRLPSFRGAACWMLLERGMGLSRIGPWAIELDELSRLRIQILHTCFAEWRNEGNGTAPHLPRLLGRRAVPNPSRAGHADGFTPSEDTLYVLLDGPHAGVRSSRQTTGVKQAVRKLGFGQGNHLQFCPPLHSFHVALRVSSSPPLPPKKQCIHSGWPRLGDTFT